MSYKNSRKPQVKKMVAGRKSKVESRKSHNSECLACCYPTLVPLTCDFRLATFFLTCDFRLATCDFLFDLRLSTCDFRLATFVIRLTRIKPSFHPPQIGWRF